MLPRYFSQLLSHLWSQNETREPLVQFRNLMGSLYPMYATYDQQDSHEFLVNLLDRLHEDLNRAVSLQSTANPLVHSHWSVSS